MTRLSRLAPAMLLLATASCVSTVTKEVLSVNPEIARSSERYRREYILSPGDALEVFVYRNPELSRNALVRLDGYISLPVLDEVHVAGLSVPELDEHLTARYAERLVDPEVTIIVTNAREPMVYVVGEVGLVQALPLRTAQTAAQAIAQSGGMKNTAAKGHVGIVRLNEEGQLCAYLVEGGGQGQPSFYMALQNTLLDPDDLVVVPESNRSQFTRFVADYINAPLGGFNQILSPYFQFKLVREVERQLDNQ